MRRNQLIVTCFIFAAGILFYFFISRSTVSPTIKPSLQGNSRQSLHVSLGKIPEIPLHLPSGYVIHVFVNGLGNPRDLVFSPNGTLLVSNPGNGEVIALPDKNHDGVADQTNIIIQGENHPHGLAFYNGKLFVADVIQLST